jgi:ubiquinone biosynthesis protein COQ9
MSETPSARFRARILEAFPAYAARLGWSDAAFKAACAEVQISEGEAQLACPRGPEDLFEAFADRADQAMLTGLDGLELETMRIRDKVRAAVQLRLEAQAPFKDAARAMTRALARPTRAGLAARLLWRTADRIWRALGDASTDANFYSKRAILSGVLASTYAKWFSDDSVECEPTWSFLGDRVENVMQFEKFKARLKPLGEGVQSVVALAARFRYGAR